ncbi:MAG TPA: phosphoribosylformylglycinamidine synthase subunit PurQ, partial [Bacteroidales bacterium]|nr:phosphoribosylformylglycinamidine synthase subunit PurQ [Bacteroidales bacterium]
YNAASISSYVENVLQLEAVACKDWLTNKVDRSVTGRIALQQTTGSVQLPLNNVAVIALEYAGPAGMATSLGHAPVAGLINAAAGSRLAIAEALTNIVWAPLKNEIKGISLSANWMWPCRNEGEDARLYQAVEAASNFAIELGINIPTGKDSLSMTQKYPDGEVILSPGTVIISAGSEVTDIRKCVTPVVKKTQGESYLYYIDFSKSEFNLGGSALAQTLNEVGDKAPDVTDTPYFAKAFNVLQKMISDNQVVAGHDISSGGLITSLLEMNFANNWSGMDIDITSIGEKDAVKVLFSEKPAVVVQCEQASAIEKVLHNNGIIFYKIGKVTGERSIRVKTAENTFSIDIDANRDTWYKTSYLLDRNQSTEKLALERFQNYKNQELKYKFPANFAGKFANLGIDPFRTNPTGVKAAIIREKGVNGDREMAYAMHLAGMDVKDVHMTDLISGREDLEDVNMIVFVGGFSNSDVLGSAKGWAGAFLYNPKAKQALENFYKRNDTLSLGVCNGCQVMIELELLTPDHDKKPRMRHNSSHKFESIFLNVDVPQNNSVMLKTLAGSRLGIWVAHGEGKFELPYEES